MATLLAAKSTTGLHSVPRFCSQHLVSLSIPSIRGKCAVQSIGWFNVPRIISNTKSDFKTSCLFLKRNTTSTAFSSYLYTCLCICMQNPAIHAQPSSFVSHSTYNHNHNHKLSVWSNCQRAQWDLCPSWSLYCCNLRRIFQPGYHCSSVVTRGSWIAQFVSWPS